MKKNKGISLDEIIKKELSDGEFKMMFEKSKFHLQVARVMVQLRNQSGLSQAEVASRAKVSQPLIARLEKGDPQRAPTFDTIFKVLKVLGYDLQLRMVPIGKKAA